MKENKDEIRRRIEGRRKIKIEGRKMIEELNKNQKDGRKKND